MTEHVKSDPLFAKENLSKTKEVFQQKQVSRGHDVLLLLLPQAYDTHVKWLHI